MKKHYSKSIVKLLVFFASLVIGVSQSDAAGAPVVGRNAAAKYFKKTGQDSGSDRYIASDTEEKEGDFKRYMMFGGSLFTSSEAYQWAGLTKEKDVAKAGVDMSYRLSQYNELLDYALRVSFNEYSANGNRASKLSILYSAMLPDAGSKFPLYFGGAIGGGVFFTQAPNESPLSFDYQLFLGLRLFEIFEKTGLFVESGIKNHIQLTSDGQLNGTYVSIGAIFTF